MLVRLQPGGKQAHSGCWRVSYLLIPVRRSLSRVIESFGGLRGERFQISAWEFQLRYVPPGSFVLPVVPSVSGLRDEQGDVVTGQEVQ